jgi:O-acetyl-ADP-ribose deacetylase (regulator of RNase III)
VKANPRKLLQSKIANAVLAPEIDIPDNILEIDAHRFNPVDSNLRIKAKICLNSTELYIGYGSVIDFSFHCDAIVNAANEFCLGGGGIDREINRRGGFVLENARRALPLNDDMPPVRCRTGDAKLTIGGDLPCKFVIHAVGPRFKGPPGIPPGNFIPWEPPRYSLVTRERDVFHYSESLDLLDTTYKNAILRAKENNLTCLGFCILSGGIFRGSCPLQLIIYTGIEAIAKYATASGLKTIFFCAFTQEEQYELNNVVNYLKMEQRIEGCRIVEYNIDHRAESDSECDDSGC